MIIAIRNGTEGIVGNTNSFLCSIRVCLWFRRYAKVKAGEIKVENWHDYVNRKILQARDEESKKKGKK